MAVLVGPTSRLQPAGLRLGHEPRECNRVCKAVHGNIATILVANVTSLPGAWKALRLEEADLFIFQELRMGSAALHKLAADAGCQLVHGDEVEERSSLQRWPARAP